MHPIERLRFVARAHGVPGDVLAAEATSALMTFVDEPAALVAACRRVLARQVSCGPLWWACARLLTADRVREVAIETLRLLEGDTTAAALSLALDPDPEAGPGPRLVQALAIGDGGAVVVAEQLAALPAPVGEGAAPAAGGAGAQRWLVGGVGCRISDPLWAALVEHWSAEPRRGEDLVPLERFTHLVGPDGPVPLAALASPDCPVAPELFRLSG